MSEQGLMYDGSGVEAAGGWDDGFPGSGEAGGWEAGLDALGRLQAQIDELRGGGQDAEAAEAAQAEAAADALIAEFPPLADPEVAHQVVEYAKAYAAHLGLPPQTAVVPSFISSVARQVFAPAWENQAAAREIRDFKGAPETRQARAMWGA